MGITKTPALSCNGGITYYEQRKGTLVTDEWPDTTWVKSRVKHVFPEIKSREYAERVYSDDEVERMSPQFRSTVRIPRNQDVIDLWEGYNVEEGKTCYTDSPSKNRDVIDSFNMGVGPLKNISQTELGTDLTIKVDVYDKNDEIMICLLYTSSSPRD